MYSILFTDLLTLVYSIRMTNIDFKLQIKIIIDDFGNFLEH